MKKNLLMVGLVLVFFGGWNEKRAQAESPCKADAQRLCPDVQPGDARFKACLHEHQSEVSEACKEILNGEHPATYGKKAACMPDKMKFCAGVTPGEGRIINCLKAQEANLSEACRQALK